MSQHAQNVAAPTHWARLEERGVYWGLKFMFLAYRWLGRRVFSVFLFPVILYFFFRGNDARRASLDFQNRIYAMEGGGAALGSPPGWQTSFKHFYEFGQSILDKVAAWTDAISLDDIVFENDDLFEKYVTSQKGLVLIGSHLGNMEVCRALGSRHRGLRLNVLVHTKHSENFSRIMAEVNPDATVALIQTTDVGPGTAMQLNAAVERGEIVVIAGDRPPQNASDRHSWAPFLGKMAPFPHGPYILASLFKCPVQLIFCIKQEGGYHISLEPFADRIQLPRRNRDEVLAQYVQQYAKRLEAKAVKSPYQWFNFFNFWKQASQFKPDTVTSKAASGEGR